MTSEEVEDVDDPQPPARRRRHRGRRPPGGVAALRDAAAPGRRAGVHGRVAHRLVTSRRGPEITARLFYVANDGLHLSAVEREVPFGATTVDQATAIVNAQLAAVQPPLVSAIPTGTTLLALYVTDKGDAYVDLSPEASTNHPGGTTAELQTVYTIVDALTVNLPAISAVQILVNGQEVDTLAGHVDLRRPLQKDLTIVQTPSPAPPPSGARR